MTIFMQTQRVFSRTPFVLSITYSINWFLWLTILFLNSSVRVHLRIETTFCRIDARCWANQKFSFLQAKKQEAHHFTYLKLSLKLSEEEVKVAAQASILFMNLQTANWRTTNVILSILRKDAPFYRRVEYSCEFIARMCVYVKRWRRVFHTLVTIGYSHQPFNLVGILAWLLTLFIIFSARQKWICYDD